jgi:hypothetical protein
MTDILQRLQEACVGHPHAKIPWPHRLLHDAVAEIDRLRQENDQLTLQIKAEEVPAPPTPPQQA